MTREYQPQLICQAMFEITRSTYRILVSTISHTNYKMCIKVFAFSNSHVELYISNLRCRTCILFSLLFPFKLFFSSGAMIPLDPTTIVTACFVLLLTIYFFQSRKPAGLPPGPKAWPIIGNLNLVYKNEYFHNTLDELSAKYGGLFSECLIIYISYFSSFYHLFVIVR